MYLDFPSSRLRRYRLRAMSKRHIVLSKTDEDMVSNELYIRTNVRHAFLINQVCAFQDYDNLFYVTEYAPLKLLRTNQLPRKFSPAIVRFYAAEILCGLAHLHARGQIYTFLSPENVLLGCDGHIKLDYSFCNCLNEKNGEVLDYIEYASLDCISGNNFSIAGDYWSFGIILYQMAMGYTPFGSESSEETIASMLSAPVEFPCTIDADLRDLIMHFLNKDSAARLGSLPDDIDIIKGHPFFSGVDWDELEKKNAAPPFIPVFASTEIIGAPSLGTLYTSDFIVGDKDGYGSIFSNYNSVSFLRNRKR